MDITFFIFHRVVAIINTVGKPCQSYTSSANFIESVDIILV